MYYPPNANHVIIPAQPNWSVAWPYREDGKEGVTLLPVIAWFIVHRVSDYATSVKTDHRQDKVILTNPYPITAEGVEDGDGWCLKDPNGHFTILNDRICETEAELLAHWAAFKEVAQK
jgi:hypothetical protein